MGACGAGGDLGNAIVSVRGAYLESAPGLTGQLARLTLGYDRQIAGRPTRLIVKFSASDPAARSLMHAMGFFAREIGFYQTLAERTPLSTPLLMGAVLDPASGTAVLLLEDLAPARNGNTLQGCSLDDVDLVTCQLARLHGRLVAKEGTSGPPMAATQVIHSTRCSCGGFRPELACLSCQAYRPLDSTNPSGGRVDQP